MEHPNVKILLAMGILSNYILYAEANPKGVKQPNILLIIADDLGTDALSMYNDGRAKTAETPNLDRLSKSGITFNSVWGAALSSPSRASMITGRYGFRTGVVDLNTDLSSSETTIQKYLKEQTKSSYANAIIGKWHLSRDAKSPTKFGAEYFAGFMGGGVRDYNNWRLTINGETRQESEYITTKLTDLATEWINGQEKPWFCWLAYSAPHTPLHLPPSHMHLQGDLPKDTESINDNPISYLLAMVESLDYEIGRLLDGIDTEELKNTVIIFVGDNGTDRFAIQYPYSRSQAKGSLYEGGVRVPMIVSGVGVTRKGEYDNNLICLSDIFSTIVELTGKEQAVYHDSYSFKPLLSSPSKGTREYSFTELIGRRSAYNNAIRNEQYKLISIKDGEQVLFDLKRDPYEKKNLLDGDLDQEQQLAYRELQEELDKLNINISDEKNEKSKTSRGNGRGNKGSSQGTRRRNNN